MKTFLQKGTYVIILIFCSISLQAQVDNSPFVVSKNERFVAFSRKILSIQNQFQTSDSLTFNYANPNQFGSYTQVITPGNDLLPNFSCHEMISYFNFADELFSPFTKQVFEQDSISREFSSIYLQYDFVLKRFIELSKRVEKFDSKWNLIETLNYSMNSKKFELVYRNSKSYNEHNHILYDSTINFVSQDTIIEAKNYAYKNGKLESINTFSKNLTSFADYIYTDSTINIFSGSIHLNQIRDTNSRTYQLVTPQGDVRESYWYYYANGMTYNKQKSDYEYDEKNRLIESTHYTVNQNSGATTISKINRYQYSNENEILVHEYELWENGISVHKRKTESEYQNLFATEKQLEQKLPNIIKRKICNTDYYWNDSLKEYQKSYSTFSKYEGVQLMGSESNTGSRTVCEYTNSGNISKVSIYTVDSNQYEKLKSYENYYWAPYLHPDLKVDNETELYINIYPNPVIDIAHVLIQGQSNEPISIKVFNVLGEQVYNRNLFLESRFMYHKIDFSSFSKGTYLVQINNSIFEKIIKLSHN